MGVYVGVGVGVPVGVGVGVPVGVGKGVPVGVGVGVSGLTCAWARDGATVPLTASVIASA